MVANSQRWTRVPSGRAGLVCHQRPSSPLLSQRQAGRQALTWPQGAPAVQPLGPVFRSKRPKGPPCRGALQATGPAWWGEVLISVCRLWLMELIASPIPPSAQLCRVHFNHHYQ